MGDSNAAEYHDVGCVLHQSMVCHSMLLYSIKRFVSMLNQLHFNQKPALTKPIIHTLTDYAEQLMIVVSVVQCVQRGLVNLDETAGLLLPEYANPDILISFNQQTGVTILTTATKPITLSLMLSYFIGMSSLINPLLLTHQKQLSADTNL
jgi:hypothetical protein